MGDLLNGAYDTVAGWFGGNSNDQGQGQSQATTAPAPVDPVQAERDAQDRQMKADYTRKCQQENDARWDAWMKAGKNPSDFVPRT
jgi:hypothetical protein